MGHMFDAVKGGIAHDDIGRAHIDLCPQHMFTILEFTGPHALEEIQIFFDGALPIGAVLAGFG